MNSVIENASAMAISVIQQMKHRAEQQGHKIIVKDNRMCVSAGVFDHKFEWVRLARMAMVADVLKKPFVLRDPSAKIPIPYVDSPDFNRSEIFLGLNRQLFNFMSEQSQIPQHCVMFRVADNDINNSNPAFAELLNMYADGMYHSLKFNRDTIIYMYYMGQIEFELGTFDDRRSVRLASDYDAAYVHDLQAVIDSIKQEFPKG